MSAHTPGPWMFLASVVPGQFVICNEHGPRVDVALTYGFEHTPRDANAHLIAAAPELLEVAEMVLGFANEHMSQALIDAAVEAVSKARGLRS